MVAVDFQLEACPHCGASAEVREHAVYRYQCQACGAPRIPTHRRWMTTPSSVTRNLKQVRGHHIQRGLWLAASWALWIATVLCALFGAGTAWSLEFGARGWTFVSVLTLLPLVLAVTTRFFAANQRRQSVSRLEDAWREMAGHFFASAAAQGRPTPTLADVKAAFRVDNDVALRLLSEGEVAAFLEHDSLANSPAGPVDAPARVRVAEPLAAPRAMGDEANAASNDALQRSRSK